MLTKKRLLIGGAIVVAILTALLLIDEPDNQYDWHATHQEYGTPPI